MKKRIYLKSWVEKLLSGITATSFVLVATTIDSEWTKSYLLFLVINVLVLVVNTKILIKFGRNFVEED